MNIPGGGAGVPSVERALAAIEVLAESKEGFSISEMARRLGAPKSSIHLILTTLEHRGYLKKNARSRRYFLGLKLASLTKAALEGLEIRQEARPSLLGLTQQTGLTVHLAVLDGHEAVLIDRIETPGLIKLNTWVGQRMQVNCTAVGKALIAFLPEDELRQVLLARRLIRHNANTISSVKSLKLDLARVRALGYSMDDQEEEIGVRCIGAPIFDFSEKVAAAISVAGATAQIPPDRVPPLAKLVVQAAAAISLQAGYLHRRR